MSTLEQIHSYKERTESLEKYKKSWTEALSVLGGIYGVQSDIFGELVNGICEKTERTVPVNKLIVIASVHNGGASTAKELASSLGLPTIRGYSSRLPRALREYSEYSPLEKEAILNKIDQGWIAKHHISDGDYWTAFDVSTIVNMLEDRQRRDIQHVSILVFEWLKLSIKS